MFSFTSWFLLVSWFLVPPAACVSICFFPTSEEVSVGKGMVIVSHSQEIRAAASPGTTSLLQWFFSCWNNFKMGKSFKLMEVSVWDSFDAHASYLLIPQFVLLFFLYLDGPHWAGWKRILETCQYNWRGCDSGIWSWHCFEGVWQWLPS